MCRHDVSPDRGRRPTGELMTMKTIGAALVSAALVASLAGTAVTAEAAPTTSKAAASTAVTIDAKRRITMPATVAARRQRVPGHQRASRRGFQLGQPRRGLHPERGEADVKNGLRKRQMSRRCGTSRPTRRSSAACHACRTRPATLLGRPRAGHLHRARRLRQGQCVEVGHAHGQRPRHGRRRMPSGGTIKAVRRREVGQQARVDPAQGHADLQEPRRPEPLRRAWRR